MGTRMVKLHLDAADATVPKVLAKFGLNRHEIDAAFGVVALSPEQRLYAILVDEKVAAKLEAGESVGGAFSNPRIETFGPPQK